MPEGEREQLETPQPQFGVRAYTPDVLLSGGETLELGGISFEVVGVPGHSPAHVAYYADGAVFSGDVLFAGSVGRTDLPGSDWEILLDSIRAPPRPLPGRDRRLSRPRPRNDARRRARPQPVPRRAARVVKFLTFPGRRSRSPAPPGGRERRPGA